MATNANLLDDYDSWAEFAMDFDRCREMLSIPAGQEVGLSASCGARSPLRSSTT